MRFTALALAAVGASAGAMADEQPGVSPWVEGFNNKVRLIAGFEPDFAGHAPRKVAGVEIDLPPGWKTYWRAPGDSGVPPEFDFSASENLKSAEVLYPAPHRLADRGGTNAGYKEHVIFPVMIAAADEAKPVHLKLKATFGACKELCIPVEAELELPLPVELNTSAAVNESLMAALANVPVAGAPPKLASWSIDRTGAKPKLVLQVEMPADATGGDAFVDIADGTYLPVPKKVAEARAGATYEVDLSVSGGVDIKTLKGKTIRVTLTSSIINSETGIKVE